MQTIAYDRYALTPPSTWIGREWVLTRTDAEGNYLRGTILDVRAGEVQVQTPAGISWCSTSRGTLART